MVDVNLLLVLASMVIFVGFMGSLAFSRTKIPSIIWLLIFGIALRPIVGEELIGSILTFTPVFASVALIIILFDGGLNLKLFQVFREASRSTLLALVTFVLSVAAIMFIWAGLGNDVYLGLLLGTILGGTSSAVVIPIVNRINLAKKTGLILTIESAITDVLCVVFTIVVLDIIGAQTFAFSATSHDIVSAFSIGGVMGMVGGMTWFFILDKFKEERQSYMITLGALFFLYGIVEYLKGSGAIACLVFGIVLGNGADISRMFRFREKYHLSPELRRFHGQISFFIRSFFFVYLGMLMTFTNVELILYGFFITVGLFGIRYAAASLALRGEAMPPGDRRLMDFMIPRGLAAAVLLQLPLSLGVEGAGDFPVIIFSVILFSIVFTTIGVFQVERGLFGQVGVLATDSPAKNYAPPVKKKKLKLTV